MLTVQRILEGFASLQHFCGPPESPGIGFNGWREGVNQVGVPLHAGYFLKMTHAAAPAMFHSHGIDAGIDAPPPILTVQSPSPKDHPLPPPLPLSARDDADKFKGGNWKGMAYFRIKKAPTAKISIIGVMVICAPCPPVGLYAVEPSMAVPVGPTV